ncbi:tetratricopeptide repeat protein [Blastococcus xanthinilyticus]|uniref:Tetratricopeptide repeat protein n=1 Tax=Blastococcus xanthinilyticus TaxID=1564164 RepID=A0A5S5D5P8_9ACTN|nr:tetratricopeptide repeat protein [Blastococcus xanthinilyticus]TYP90608.1 tetratricopeptide repeat protein [Blastococcus xanthinilyticus]
MEHVDREAAIQAGIRLAEAEEHAEAVAYLAHAVDLGADEALFHLAFSLCRLQRWTEAAGAFLRAAEVGDDDAWLNLAIVYVELERWAEAEWAAEHALGHGEEAAWGPLGYALLQQGDQEGAKSAFEAATSFGDEQSMIQLALLLRSPDLGRAKQLLQMADEAGDSKAAAILACWQWDDSLDPSLERTLRLALEAYSPACVSLADLLLLTGRTEEALTQLQRGAERGEKACWLPLGNILLDHFDDVASAERAYRSGIAAGDTNCFYNLGALLLDRGDTAAALEQFQRGADAGDQLAARALRRQS